MHVTTRINDLDHKPSALLESARRFFGAQDCVNRKLIADVTRSHGIEFATAVLFHHFADKLCDDLIDRPTLDTQDKTLQRNPNPNATLAIVPGALYLERPEIGADGDMLRHAADKNDWLVDLVPTNGVGRVEENGKIIREWIDARSDDSLILVSLSRGTTDTIAALLENDQTIPANVVGWVNISGIPFGTPMVNWMMDRWIFRRVYRFACWIRNASPMAAEDLAFKRSRIETVNRRDLPFPVYHLAGFPCREHLSCQRARLWYRRFKNDGPTDSVLMLADLLDLPGTVIPIWGADHYLKTGWDSCQMFERIIAHLTRQNRASDAARSAQQPTAKVGHA